MVTVHVVSCDAGVVLTKDDDVVVWGQGEASLAGQAAVQGSVQANSGHLQTAQQPLTWALPDWAHEGSHVSTFCGQTNMNNANHNYQ